jgi:hypothetical protein
MPDVDIDIDTTWLDQLAEKLEGMTVKDLPQIERAGLRSVNEVVKPALIEATPVALQTPSELSTALPVGKLKSSVRARVLEPRNGLGRAAVVDFGKYGYIANWVDAGHVLVKGGRKGKGREIGHVEAKPFIRAVQDSLQTEAEEAMVAGAEAEVEQILNGR